MTTYILYPSKFNKKNKHKLLLQMD